MLTTLASFFALSITSRDQADQHVELMLRSEGATWVIDDESIYSLDDGKAITSIGPVESVRYSSVYKRWLISNRFSGSVFLWHGGHQRSDETLYYADDEKINNWSDNGEFSVYSDSLQLVKRSLPLIAKVSGHEVQVIADAPDFSVGFLIVPAGKGVSWCFVPDRSADAPGLRVNAFRVSDNKSQHFGVASGVGVSSKGELCIVTNLGKTAENYAIWEGHAGVYGMKLPTSVKSAVLENDTLFWTTRRDGRPELHHRTAAGKKLQPPKNPWK